MRGRRRLLFGILGGLVAFAATVASAPAASAHPLGNFTVNRYARVEVSAGVVRVYYVLDEAEIPAFEDRQAVEADPPAFARKRTDDIIAHLRLTLDGRPLALSSVSGDLSQPMGQGGLHTLRLAAVLSGDAEGLEPGSRHQVSFADDNEPDRVGWREIVVVARGDAGVVESSAPNRDASDELRHYPGDLLHAPLDLRSAGFTFTAGTVAVPALSIARPAAA